MKILLTHASAGAGHMKAAEALYNALKEDTRHEAVFVDALDHVHPFYRKMYRESYSFMVTKIPLFWGFVFALLDLPSLQPLVRFGRRIYNAINCHQFQKYLIDQQFDYVISTHFMPTEITAALKRKGKISSKLITVVTDYDVHRIWLANGVDMYCVASDWTQAKVVQLGVEVPRVFATGIPTDERFAKDYDIAELKQKLAIKPDMFTVLVATGSFGIGPIEEIIETLQGFQVVVVCGHNKALFERLSQKVSETVRVFGLVDNMFELMAVSNAMVTKPGGLSISEALVSQLPMIFFNAIPGQETGNVRVLKEHGIGISDCSIAQIALELEKLQTSKDAFLTTLKRTKRLARPSAVKDIISLIV